MSQNLRRARALSDMSAFDKANGKDQRSSTSLMGVWSIRPRVEETTVSNRTAIVGDTVILPCRIRDLGRHKVVWADSYTTTLTFKDRRIIDDQRFSVDTNHKNDWNLKLENVKIGDGGEYACTVNTKPAITHKVHLTVVEPPRITTPSQDSELNVPEFERVILNCTASGTPRPTITWKRQAEAKETKNEIIGTGNILIIHNTTRDCGGVYYCEAENSAHRTARRIFDIKVEFPPEIKLDNKRLGQAVGKETVLGCTISGRPKSLVYWEFKGQRIGTASYHNKKKSIDVYDSEEDEVRILLTIKDIEPQDFGHYKCVGKNNMGRAQRQMELYEHKIRTQAPPTTTAPPTTHRPKSMLARTRRPHNSFSSDSVKIPKGRAGAGYNRQDVIDTEKGSRYPAASSHRDGENSCSDLLPFSNKLIIPLVIPHRCVLLLLRAYCYDVAQRMVYSPCTNTSRFLSGSGNFSTRGPCRATSASTDHRDTSVLLCVKGLKEDKWLVKS
ncbi:hypothetical protein RRG08_037185 [Elysia crispata]|uniref:Ig-like domain-containing protein n=1 Tax=Elysia crispata TaxID=231223 RepID=A0AAE1DA74_9GAST|nr:hypothetical protein RRG08_037185 [Elysia crispata]